MREPGPPKSAYKGLEPYLEGDAPFFAGREPERDIVIANLLGARLTLLYGESGVGKTSLLRAGVAHQLRQIARQHLIERAAPEFAVVVFDNWRDSPVVGLAEEIRHSVGRTLNAPNLEDFSPSLPLSNTLQWCTKRDLDLLIVLDQFEEYFLYHEFEGGEGTFALEFPRVVGQHDLRASFLISIRADALAKLDRFKGRIPELFDNYLRIDHLDWEAAQKAITSPIDAYNRLQTKPEGQISVEPELVNAVLEQVTRGRVQRGLGGSGVTDVSTSLPPGEARIEAPYLQLVMTRLWDEERRAGSPKLRRTTLSSLGGAESIVHTHLDNVMRNLQPDEQDDAARVFQYLVTPGGTKIALDTSTIADWAKVPEPRVKSILSKLAAGKARVLRAVASPHDQEPAQRYEIFHDMLAEPILKWRGRHLQARDRDEALLRVILPSLWEFGLGMYFIVLGTALLYGLLSLMPGRIPLGVEDQVPFLGGRIAFKVAPEIRYLLISAVAGALGGYVQLATSFFTYTRLRQFFGDWRWWYLTEPLTSAAMALIIYVVIRAGFAAGGASAQVLNPYGVAAISAFTGMSSRQASSKLREIFESLFKIRTKPVGSGKLATPDEQNEKSQK